MKTRLAILILVSSLTLRATDFYFYNEDGFSLLAASGSAYDAGTDLRTVRIGAFADGFAPSSTNIASWTANFLAGDGAGGYIIDAGGYLEWGAGFQLANNDMIAAGSQLYLWVYTSLDIVSDSAEWLLVTDPSWQTVVSSALDPTSYYFDFGVSTTAIVGSFDYAAKTAQLAKVDVIPEPAAYAALFGAGALGFALLPRKRVSLAVK